MGNGWNEVEVGKRGEVKLSAQGYESNEVSGVNEGRSG